jgi:hypothetical protein
VKKIADTLIVLKNPEFSILLVFVLVSQNFTMPIFSSHARPAKKFAGNYIIAIQLDICRDFSPPYDPRSHKKAGFFF